MFCTAEWDRIAHRVTLLPGVLLAAKHTVLQVSGADKADAAQSVVPGSRGGG